MHPQVHYQNSHNLLKIISIQDTFHFIAKDTVKYELYEDSYACTI